MRPLLLIQPPQPGLLDGFANALIDLGNFILNHEPLADVSILDLGPADATKAKLQLTSALNDLGSSQAVVGITTTTASYQSALSVARMIKDHSNAHTVVLGGHHASPQHDVILRHHQKCIDVVIRGEGERPLCALVQGHAPSEIEGTSSLKSGFLRVNGEPRSLTTAELDTLHVDFRGQLFQSAPGKFDRATYVSARGCPLRCAFCAVAGEPIRAKSVSRIIEDLACLVFERGYQRIAIEDNFFGHKRSRTLELCAAIRAFRHQTGSRFTWDCQTRLESLCDPEVIAALESAGCESVYVGVEALTAPELYYLGKTARPEHYLERLTTVVAPRLLDSNIALFMNLQVGLPCQTADTQAARLARLRELGRLAERRGKTITIFPQLSVIYPGTQHFWKAVEEHEFGKHGNDVFEAFTAWEALERPVLTFLGENFAHGVGGIPTGILDRRLLRAGEFVIDPQAVESVKQTLLSFEPIPGLDIFKYGRYLAGPNAGAFSDMGFSEVTR